MKRFALGSLMVALAAAIFGTGLVEASGPERHGNSKSTSTVSEQESKAKLVGSGAELGASGYVESKVITVTVKATGVATTSSSVSISAQRLKLANGAVVSFQVNGKAVGTGVVTNGRASFRASTKTGATVPAIVTGDKVTVVDANGASLTGTVGASRTETEGNEGNEKNERNERNHR